VLVEKRTGPVSGGSARRIRINHFCGGGGARVCREKSKDREKILGKALPSYGERTNARGRGQIQEYLEQDLEGLFGRRLEGFSFVNLGCNCRLEW